MRQCVSLWSLSLLLLLVGFATAECPNGCSGNGACMQKDMCNCYKNYQGNDCADRTCVFGYAHVDTPKGDINMDQTRKTANWILENSQQHPAKTYEYFNPDAKQNEAHFYMECSNKGICDRSTGLCTCFDGYEGVGCQRTVCPGKCNGHGTCESIRELGAKGEGTLFGIEHPSGSVVYDLWDGNSTYGCRCDPWFRGADCSKRTCKVGVDPLYLSIGTPIYETFAIHAFADQTAAITYPTASPPWIRLRVFDYYGESYITSKITILDETTPANKPLNAAAVQNALKNIPNLTFRDATCEVVGTGTGDLGDFLSLWPATDTNQLGMSVICQYIDNPGRHRIPEVVDFGFSGVTAKKAMVVTTGEQGQNDEWFTKQSTLTAPAVATVAGTAPVLGVTTLTVTGAGAGNLPTSGTLALIKVGSNIVMTNTWAVNTDPTKTDIVLKFPLKKTIGTSDLVFIPPSFTDLTMLTITAASAPISVDLKVGDTKLTFAAAHGFVTGDLLFFHNQFFYVHQVTDNATPSVAATEFYLVIDKPFGGNSETGGTAKSTATGTATPYKIVLPGDKTKIYNYVSECSGRGLCSSETGLCTCFKGYTNDNCNTQNILAL
uniref:EGF-like domain-containing protein n=2 Tax=Globisporangium ultimum TaxID=2052682 RepID=K3WEX2_GLOUD